MKSLETIAADLAEYIDARQRFLTAESAQQSPLKMNEAQHLEVARLLLNPERLIRILDLNAASMMKSETADLVGVLDAVYTALAHLGVAYQVRWAIPEKVDATTNASADSGRDDGQPRGDAPGAG